MNTNTTSFIGILFTGADATRNFYQIKCPCGVEVTYPLNGLLEIDTLMPCGNPNHWAVKYEDDALPQTSRGETYY